MTSQNSQSSSASGPRESFSQDFRRFFLRGLAALIVVLCLWVAILLTTVQFWKVDRFAAALLLPYLAWVGFATALNYQIYRLN